MANLYTAGQVDDTLLRAQVAMYLISEEIGAKFYYLNVPVYNNYKDLQYDIYTLYQVIIEAKQFVTYNPVATLFEDDFYMLVGALINKIKQVDVYGAFGGTTNPNYQDPSGIIIVEVTEVPNPTIDINKTEADLVDADPPNGLWYLPFLDESGAFLPNGSVPVSVTINGNSFTFTYSTNDPTTFAPFTPPRIYGFASNVAPQSIIVTVVKAS
jgi:hypothetical protein